MNAVKGRLPKLSGQEEHAITFAKWLVFAAICGVVCGGVATAFYYAFSAVTAATGFSNLWDAPNMVTPQTGKALLRLRCDSGQQQRMMGELAALGASRVSSEN